MGSKTADAKPKSCLEFLKAYWWVGAAAACVIFLIYGICHFYGNDPRTKVGVGEECTEKSECKHDLCQVDPRGSGNKKTCRAKPGDKCKIAEDHCLEEHACSDVEPHVCKAVIGGSCRTPTDCYQNVYALTNSWRQGKSTRGQTLEDSYQPVTWCDKEKRCQVFAGRDWNKKASICDAGSSVKEVAGESLCKADASATCHDPRGRPMPSWCLSGICESATDDQLKRLGHLRKEGLYCKAGKGEYCYSDGHDFCIEGLECKQTAPGEHRKCTKAATKHAQIQIGETTNAWHAANRSRLMQSDTLRNKRTHTAGFLQVDGD